MAGDMDQVWDYCIAISKKFIMALKRQSTTVDFKEYTPEYKKEQSYIDHLLGFKCEVMMINDENVNVVCPPGGKIVVFTELKTFAAVEEIGTVIDHEVSSLAISSYIPR
uniref:Mitochondrial metalloendopeptidase OMA1-like isoform X2 n=1 Tax=Tanacetum cinerariifolium TaxID=118510 RepID=A0A699J1X6_TANCI|nr:mitochondrial metalloendopeptidase OMA1-like isoform X2 [Tanacetum cinerariifolium]